MGYLTGLSCSEMGLSVSPALPLEVSSLESSITDLYLILLSKLLYFGYLLNQKFVF